MSVVSNVNERSQPSPDWFSRHQVELHQLETMDSPANRDLMTFLSACVGKLGERSFSPSGKVALDIVVVFDAIVIQTSVVRS